MNNQLKIEYYSDLHLECEKRIDEKLLNRIFKLSGPILVLAGDIINPFQKKFEFVIDWLSSRYEHVIYVAGNHEYYSHSIEETNKLLQNQKPNFHFLNNDNFILHWQNKKIKFIGSTLWSFIPEDMYSKAENYLNDFEQIANFSPALQSEFYKLAYQYLLTELSEVENCCDITIMVTHHAPVRQVCLAPMYRNQPINCCFESDCSELFKISKIDFWLSGHTHFNTEFTIDNIKFISNQRGYRGQTAGYQPGKFLIIE